MDGDGDTICRFCDTQGPTVLDNALAICDLLQPGWTRLYPDPGACLSGDCEIVCAEGCPQDKVRIPANVECPEHENLIKMTKLITYKGKLVRLVVVTCG